MRAGPAGMTGPAVVADAYDMYADQLYAYCRFLVRDPADAVDALEDTFLVAAGRGAALPLGGQLRTWLFAVARNECLRSIGSRGTWPGPAPRPGSDSRAHSGSRPGDRLDAYTERALLAAAADGLAPVDRDLVAMLWHGLDADDIATVFGVSRDEAFGMLDRALVRLETATSALLVARSGRQACADLAAQLRGWDGRLDVPLVRRVTRHLERCQACSARRQGELRPALLLSLTPAALLGAGVSAEALRPAAATIGEVRAQVLGLACDRSEHGARARARACGQAGPFGARDDSAPLAQGAGPDGPPRVGFPVPIPAEPGRRVPRRRLAVILTAAAAVAMAATAGLVTGGGQAPAADSPMAGISHHQASAVTMTGTSASSPAPAPTRSALASAPPSSSQAPSSPASSSPASSPTPTQSRTASAAATSPRASARPTPVWSVPSSVTLQWNRSQGQLTGTLTVTVSGGALSWSISNPNHDIQLSQASGTQSASVQISGRSHGNPQPLTVTAGSSAATVTLTVGN